MTMTLVIVLIVELFLFRLSRGESEGDLRFGSSWTSGNSIAGRLEVYLNGAWGTICDDKFDSADARVACRQLGYSTENALSYTAGCSSAEIRMDELNCGGTESKLRYCSYDSSHDCTHSEDVGVLCYKNRKVQGNWGSWNSWEACSRTCGNGYRKRRRYCNNPRPSYGGSCCSGDSLDIQNCNNRNCAVDGIWGQWTTWGSCNATCGSGIQSRYRRCDNPAPYFGGVTCTGLRSQIGPCNATLCENQEETQCSAVIIGGVAVGGVAGILVLLLVGYCIYRRVEHPEHGKHAIPSSQNMDNLTERRDRQIVCSETYELPCQQNGCCETYEVPRNSTGSEIYDKVASAT